MPPVLVFNTLTPKTLVFLLSSSLLTLNTAAELLDVLQPTNGKQSARWTPSSLSALAEEDSKNPFVLSTSQIPNYDDVEKPVVAAPVPAGYNPGIYKEVKELAVQGKDPSREKLTDLFKLMKFDSPYGEMKEEALAIWREMRSRQIIPTKEGYVALLHVHPLL